MAEEARIAGEARLQRLSTTPAGSGGGGGGVDELVEHSCTGTAAPLECSAGPRDATSIGEPEVEAADDDELLDKVAVTPSNHAVAAVVTLSSESEIVCRSPLLTEAR